IKPAVEWVKRPRRPREDLPSRRPARSLGRVNFSKVAASTNSPGCSTKDSPSGTSTSVVKSGMSRLGSMWVYFELLKTRKYLSMRTSTLDGWISSGSKGSMPRRPASMAARISLSDRSTMTLQVSKVLFLGVHLYFVTRRRSLVVEHQLPKLRVRVRFSSPADRKSTRLNSSHVSSSYAACCLNTQTTVVYSCRQ